MYLFFLTIIQTRKRKATQYLFIGCIRPWDYHRSEHHLTETLTPIIVHASTQTKTVLVTLHRHHQQFRSPPTYPTRIHCKPPLLTPILTCPFTVPLILDLFLNQRHQPELRCLFITARSPLEYKLRRFLWSFQEFRLNRGELGIFVARFCWSVYSLCTFVYRCVHTVYII